MGPLTRRRSALSTPRTKVITKGAADINTANIINGACSEDEVTANAEAISGNHVLIAHQIRGWAFQQWRLVVGIYCGTILLALIFLALGLFGVFTTVKHFPVALTKSISTVGHHHTASDLSSRFVSKHNPSDIQPELGVSILDAHSVLLQLNESTADLVRWASYYTTIGIAITQHGNESTDGFQLIPAHRLDLEALECQIDDHIVYYHSKVHLAGKRLAWLVNDIVLQLQSSGLALRALVSSSKELTNPGFESNGVDRYFQRMIAETSGLFNSSRLCRLELDSIAPIWEDIDGARQRILQRRGMMPWWSSYWYSLWQSGPRQKCHLHYGDLMKIETRQAVHTVSHVAKIFGTTLQKLEIAQSAYREGIQVGYHDDSLKSMFDPFPATIRRRVLTGELQHLQEQLFEVLRRLVALAQEENRRRLFGE
ncbi:hypothetical protein H2202_010090 [Exophiala xenobiotica]|nr:hypothetical protein H2202_010090 [Exophiala xenobiotica]KAK5194810.1 hypothetical protein LTR92_004939 [Exophiala xenobiotica]KAK5209159.1 hypothetical protein LTR41_005558 [Exophiala xenobiotica]KAK5234279.1 hypothetical protein LTR47_004870 [Exophiala xenobiotica]KAK5248385.1 hypothetical protein LTS06_006583 [Exophiala xenobiotica]